MRIAILLYRTQAQSLLHRSSLRGTSKYLRSSSRTFASAAAPPSPQTSVLKTPSLAALQSELDKLGPRIPISPTDVQILSTPADFYATLKAKILSAKRRIFLSTLYIGKTELELISTIRHALLQNGPELRVSILTDALRGTRESPEPCCASMLAELVEEFPDRVEVRMYHTPNLTGLKKRVVPRRINEGWGLQHIKLYACDDEIILSGANLSSDYFTNRQDRYHLFSSRLVTDYFAKIHDTVCSASFRVLPSKNPAKFELVWREDNKVPSPLKMPQTYLRGTTRLLEPLTAAATPSDEEMPLTSPDEPSQTLFKPSSNDTSDAPTTYLYPVLTHPPLLNMELPSIHILLTSPYLKFFTFTAGYFNPHPSITDRLLYAAAPNISSTLDSQAQRHNKIITAHPYANGFFGSNGISGLLPAAYSHLLLRFSKQARRHQSDLQMREWRRGKVGEPNGWTYHAKGMWLWYGETQREEVEDVMNRKRQESEAEAMAKGEIPNVLQGFKDEKAKLEEERERERAIGPQVTLIGSSNYTKRSNELDLEAGVVLITEDPTLRTKLKEEEEALVAQSQQVTIRELRSKDRRADWKTKLAMWIVGKVGGAL